MSDCSTQAMIPKEQPRTCGNCFYSIPRKYGHWNTNDLICLRHAVSTNSDRHYVTECGCGISGPAGWRPKEPTREQKLEQLTRKAIEGYREAASLLKAIYDDGYVGIAKGANVYVEDAEEIAASLEALGVRVDD